MQKRIQRFSIGTTFKEQNQTSLCLSDKKIQRKTTP